MSPSQNSPSTKEGPPANRYAKLSLITGTGAVVMVLLVILTAEMVMKWIGEIEALTLYVLQFLGIVLLAICAIVFGKIGLREIQAEPETQGGKKKAVTGLVLGAIVGILALLGIASIIHALGSYSSGQ
ncbi:MAG: hypothetical protein CMN02_14505 [Roseibacillus sp.]|nr:hypothetical protein [Roseibacillus sp.]